MPDETNVPEQTGPVETPVEETAAPEVPAEATAEEKEPETA